MRPLKPETEIRNLKREVKRLRSDNIDLKTKNYALADRATKATREAEDWKKRFDTLLSRDAGSLFPTKLKEIGT